MKRFLLFSFVMLALTVFSTQAWALSVTPSTYNSTYDYIANNDLSGGTLPTKNWSDNNQEAINQVIAWINTHTSDNISTLLYKDEEDGEEGTIPGSYETNFTWADDDSGGTISYTGGDIATDAWLLVKDGSISPSWYLFDLTNLNWDGIDPLVIGSFWPGSGAISHVSLYGSTSAVPLPSAISFLAIGLLGLAGVSRRKK